MTKPSQSSQRPTLGIDGCERFSKAVASTLPALVNLLSPYDTGLPGRRIAGDLRLRQILSIKGPLRAVLDHIFAQDCQPVRANLFDKSPQQNWGLGWHQDRTICVRQKIEAPGFGPFSMKQGLVHVEPPFPIIENMRTLRIHLDPVTTKNAPLLAASGSHQIGRIPAQDVSAEALKRRTITCLADAGDVWAYATSILHASQPSTALQRRRVLQVDYSSGRLPGGLEWLGV